MGLQDAKNPGRAKNNTQSKYTMHKHTKGLCMEDRGPGARKVFLADQYLGRREQIRVTYERGFAVRVCTNPKAPTH